MRSNFSGSSLHVSVFHSGEPLLLLHGFTGSTKTWDAFQNAWSGRRIVTVDLLGHGDSDSPVDANRYSIDRAIVDFLEILDGLEMSSVSVLGYSMGGRVALRLALEAPGRVAALILESVSPGIVDKYERAARIAQDNMLANRIERDGISAFVREWESMPLWESQSKLTDDVRLLVRNQRLKQSTLGLSNSLRGMGVGMADSVLDRLSELTIPTLLISGELDEKYCDLARMMKSRISNAELAIVPGAGHAVHLEKPNQFGHLVANFLNSIQIS